MVVFSYADVQANLLSQLRCYKNSLQNHHPPETMRDVSGGAAWPPTEPRSSARVTRELKILNYNPVCRLVSMDLTHLHLHVPAHRTLHPVTPDNVVDVIWTVILKIR